LRVSLKFKGETDPFATEFVYLPIPDPSK